MALRPVDDSYGGEDKSGFAPHDRVRIGGRTMLRPGHSLVGREGTVFALGGWCPPGHAQIIVDDEVVEEDGGSRVMLVNVPVAHLEKLASRGGEKADEESHPFRPRLTPVDAVAVDVVPVDTLPVDAAEDSDPKEGVAQPESPEPAPPSGLRLV